MWTLMMCAMQVHHSSPFFDASTENSAQSRSVAGVQWHLSNANISIVNSGQESLGLRQNTIGSKKKGMKKGNKYANRVLPSAKRWPKAPLLLTTKSQWRWCCKCSNQLCQPALSSPSLGSRSRGCSGVRPTSKRHWDLESWHGPSWRRRHPNTKQVKG